MAADVKKGLGGNDVQFHGQMLYEGRSRPGAVGPPNPTPKPSERSSEEEKDDSE